MRMCVPSPHAGDGARPAGEPAAAAIQARLRLDERLRLALDAPARQRHAHRAVGKHAQDVAAGAAMADEHDTGSALARTAGPESGKLSCTVNYDSANDAARGGPRLHVRRLPAAPAVQRARAARSRRSIDLSCRFSTHITLKRPLVSANMDTVTRAPMAIVQAEEGGIGIIDRGFRNGDIEPQVREVEKVKRTQHGIIRDPYTVAPRRRSPTRSR